MTTERPGEVIARELFGMGHKDAIALGICIICERKADDLRDDLERREYQLSAMCSKCQRKTFKKPKGRR